MVNYLKDFILNINKQSTRSMNKAKVSIHIKPNEVEVTLQQGENTLKDEESTGIKQKR